MPMLISVKLLMHLVFAVFVAEVISRVVYFVRLLYKNCSQIILVAAIYSSKTASAPECGAMGGLLHFFVVAQFAWMMVIVRTRYLCLVKLKFNFNHLSQSICGKRWYKATTKRIVITSSISFLVGVSFKFCFTSNNV